MESVLLETTLATFLMGIEKSCVTFDSWTPVISESYYFPLPQWKGASELDASRHDCVQAPAGQSQTQEVLL